MKELMAYNIFNYVFSYIYERLFNMVYSIGYDEGIRARSNRKKVQQLGKYGKVIEEFDSTYHAERITKINSGNIRRAISGKCHTAGGFVWKYKDNGN